jgi:predicted nucleic acid-binding protein
LSRPDALFYDTSILVAHFNLHPSEDHISKVAMAYAYNLKMVPRLTVLPCLVELIHLSRKKMSPKDIRINLNALRVEVLPIDESSQETFLKEYWSGTVKNRYDLADYILCRTALLFRNSHILTMDTRDLPLAMGDAYTNGPNKSQFHFEVFK